MSGHSGNYYNKSRTILITCWVTGLALIVGGGVCLGQAVSNPMLGLAITCLIIGFIMAIQNSP